jgi:hypothetical protein
LKALIEKLESDGNIWANLQEASGGMLELKKCFFYLLSWKWDSKGNPIPKDKKSQQEKIHLNSVKIGNTNVKLTQYEVKKSHKTLGSYKCLVGCKSTHFEYLNQKSNEISIKINTCQLNRRQAKMAYNSCYIPAILYSLSAVTISQQQVDQIQQQATSAFIWKCGYDQHFPRCVVYGHNKFGGLGFLQLYVEGNIKKITALLSHVNNNTMLGKMF